MIFFTPVIVKYMKKNLDQRKTCYSEQILPAPWPFIIQCIKVPLYTVMTVISTEMWFLHCRSNRPKFNFQLDQNTQGPYLIHVTEKNVLFYVSHRQMITYCRHSFFSDSDEKPQSLFHVISLICLLWDIKDPTVL